MKARTEREGEIDIIGDGSTEPKPNLATCIMDPADRLTGISPREGGKVGLALQAGAKKSSPV